MADEDSLKALGLAFRNARKRQGLTQEAFALQAGLDRSYVGDVERGERNVGYLNMLRLSHAAGTPLAAIVADAASGQVAT